MAERPGVMVYFDVLPAVEKLPAEDAGKLFVAVLRYAQLGEEPNLDGGADLIWALMRPAIDRDAARYEAKCQQQRWKAYVREEKKVGRTPLDFMEWLSNPGYQFVSFDDL